MSRLAKKPALAGAALVAVLLVFGLSAVPQPKAVAVERSSAEDLAAWRRIADELEGEVPPQALLGADRDEHLSEVLAARGIDEATFRAGASAALDVVEDGALAEASANPLAELATELEFPEGLTSPPITNVVESDIASNAGVNALVRRLLNASRPAPRGGNP